MVRASSFFSEIVSSELERRGTNASAFERTHKFPVDAVRSIVRENRPSEPKLSRAKEIAEALGLEFYIGPKRNIDNAPRTADADNDFATIPVRDVEASAGPGAVNYTDLPDDDAPMAFRRDWLSRLGINPARAVILRVRGDSMEPTIRAGSIALIDQQRTDPARNRIYAFVDDGELRMKRLQMMPHKAIGMFSDNPAYLPEVKKHSDLRGFKILGEVVWTAYTWHDDPRTAYP